MSDEKVCENQECEAFGEPTPHSGPEPIEPEVVLDGPFPATDYQLLLVTLDIGTGLMRFKCDPQEQLKAIFDDFEARGISPYGLLREDHTGIALTTGLGYVMQKAMRANAIKNAVKQLTEAGLAVRYEREGGDDTPPPQEGPPKESPKGN